MKTFGILLVVIFTFASCSTSKEVYWTKSANKELYATSTKSTSGDTAIYSNSPIGDFSLKYGKIKSKPDFKEGKYWRLLDSSGKSAVIKQSCITRRLHITVQKTKPKDGKEI